MHQWRRYIYLNNWGLKADQNYLSLTQSGLDLSDMGYSQSKEAQPHRTPPHCCHCGLDVPWVGNVKSGSWLPFILRSDFFFLTASSCVRREDLLLVVANMCWMAVQHPSQIPYNLLLHPSSWLNKYVCTWIYLHFKTTEAAIKCSSVLNLLFHKDPIIIIY